MNSNSSSSSSSAFTNLPRHTLAEILLRLPIKTLVASTCVCKSWLHLIKDPQFSKQRHARAKLEVCFHSYYGDEITKLYIGNFHSHSNDLKLDTLFHLPKFAVRPNNVLDYEFSVEKPIFMNSCNGLLCFSGHEINGSNEFALIWNPITSEFITFPAPDTQNGLFTCISYGLGFSQNANRFKLLQVKARKERGSSKEVQLIVEMLTIERGSSWRTVGPFPWKPFGFFCYGLLIQPFLQGALHWVGADSDDLDSDMVMISFNFDDEKFGQVPLPPHLENQNVRDRARDHFGVLDGCLFIAETTKRGTNIWLMKEYGVQDSWTQVFSLEYSRCVPINFMDNGEILIRRAGSDSTDLFLYNPVLRCIRDIGSGSRVLGVIVYGPSFVQLKDSMMGYDMHVIPRCENREITTTPNWWKYKYVKDNSKSIKRRRNWRW